MTRLVCRSVVLAGFAAMAQAAPEFRAGVAEVDITPQEAIWLSGYAARTKPSDGVRTRLYAKALAIEDRRGYRVVLVTTDLIGLPRAITDGVSARAGREFGLRREQILFNSSHTHAGPVVRPNLVLMYDLDETQRRRVEEYGRGIEETLFTVLGAALGKLKPATIAFAQGSAGFAANRRRRTGTGVTFGVEPGAPVDHAVPVLEVTGESGRPVAILFGYACHNTTLGGDYYQVNGDYASYAQAEVETAHPGAEALFVSLCGGDQNPNPRGTEEQAREHGQALARAVGEALAKGKRRVRGPVKAALQVTDLAFALHTREQFQQEAADKNIYRARRARMMLTQYDERRPVRSTPYPVQAIRFREGFTLLALGGEVVVDYALRAKREYPREALMVAGYSNDVMCYIPSLRVLREGGYEAESSMWYYGMPGKFTEEVEETVFGAVRGVLKRVGARGGPLRAKP